MCIKCELKKAAMSAFGLEQVEEKLGTISSEYITELQQLNEADQKLRAQMETERDQLIEEATAKIAQQMEEKYSKKVDDLAELQQKVFKEAFVKAGISEAAVEGDIRVEKKTGDVFSRKIVKAKDAQGVH